MTYYPIRPAYIFNDPRMYTNATTLSHLVYSCVAYVVAIRPAYIFNELLPYWSRLYIQRPTYVYICNHPIRSRLLLCCLCCLGNLPVLQVFCRAVHSSLLQEAHNSKHKRDLFLTIIANHSLCRCGVGKEL